MSEELRAPPFAEKPSALVIRISRETEFRSVNLVDCAGQVLDLRANDQIHDIDMVLSVGIGRMPEPRTFLSSLGITVTPKAKDDSSRAVASLAAQFAIQYRVLSDDLFAEITDEVLGEFAAHVGSRHAWPYLRQFCQDLAQRMMLPPLILPPLVPSLLRPVPAPATT